MGKQLCTMLQINGTQPRPAEKVSRAKTEFKESLYYYYYSCQGSIGKIFICIKTYIRREKKQRPRRVCTKHPFELSSVPLQSSLPGSVQGEDLGSRLCWRCFLAEHLSPDRTFRRLSRH